MTAQRRGITKFSTTVLLLFAILCVGTVGLRAETRVSLGGSGIDPRVAGLEPDRHVMHYIDGQAHCWFEYHLAEGTLVRKVRKLGRPSGSKLSKAAFLTKHKDVRKRLREGHSIRNAAKITGKGISTIQRVKACLAS